MNDFDKAHALVPKYKAAHVFFTEGNSLIIVVLQILDLHTKPFEVFLRDMREILKGLIDLKKGAQENTS
jgi:hypothetical protein